MISWFGKFSRTIACIASFLLFIISTFGLEQPVWAKPIKGNGVNVIIMIGDGMGWEPARAGAIAKGAPFYTRGKGIGLNMQRLSGYTFATTYGTTIFDQKSGKFSTSNTATDESNPVTGSSPLRPDFSFRPTPFNPGDRKSVV